MNIKNSADNKKTCDDFRFDEESISLLDEFSVDFPQENEIDLTMKALEKYIPKRKQSFNYIEKIKYLLKRAIIDISFISIYYWIGVFSLFILGYITTVENQGNPYVTLLSLSPVPVIIGILEIFRGGEEGVFEIEMVCKTTPNELVLSRFILINFYSIILNSVLSLAFVGKNFNINLWRITLLWLTPLIFIEGVAMLISIKWRSKYVSLILLSIWGTLGIALVNLDDLMNKIIYVNIGVYIFIMLLGISMIFYVFKKSINNENFIDKACENK